MSLHISIPPELEKLVRNQIESGQYDSAEEVVGAALKRFFARPDDAEIYERMFDPALEEFEAGQANVQGGVEAFLESVEQPYA